MREKLPTQQNYFLQSESFSTPWSSIVGGSLTPNATTGPLDNRGATAIVENGNNERRYIGQTPNAALLNKTITIRVFAKKGTRNYMLVFCNTGTSLVWFDLNSGTVATSSGPAGAVPTGRITPTANGFYSCEMTVTLIDTANPVYIEAINVVGQLGYQGVNNDEAIYITGAQLNAGNHSAAYVQTTSSVYNIGDVRSKQTDRVVVNRNKLPTQQNLFAYSEDTSGWFLYEATTDVVGGSNPLGTLVTEVTESTALDFHGIYQGFPADEKYSIVQDELLVFFYAAVKQAAGRYVCVDMFLHLGDTVITIDLQTGAIIDLFTTEDPSVISDFDGGVKSLGDGWYLAWVTCRIRSDYPLNQMSAYVLNSNGDTGTAGYYYTGDGVSSFLFGGANFAIANYITPYKLTNGTAFDEGNVREKLIT